MSFVNVDPSEQANIMDSLYTEPEGQPESPGFFSGSLKAPFTGAASGVLKAADMVNDATSVLTKPVDVGFDKLFGTTNAEEADAQAAARTRAAIKYLTPDPGTTGFAGNILHGLGEMVPLAATGNVIGGAAGAAGLLGSVEGYSTYKEGREQGQDTLTAAGEGAITGALNAAGTYLPMSFGSSIIKNLPFGAAMNVAQGTLARGAIHSWLAERGYPEAAEQYKWLDGESMAVDAVLGAAFGYMGAHEEASPHGVRPTREPLPSDIDAALTLNDAIHTEVDSAPGIPTDIASRQQHNDAMQIATAQLLKGEPINVEGALDGATFEPKPHEVEMLKAIKTALDQSGYGDILQAIDEQTAKAKEMGVEPPADEALPRISGVTETLPDDTETATGATGSEQPISQGQSATADAPAGRYHGTSTPIGELQDDTYSPQNIYGQGFYTTDNLDVAQGYGKKGRGGQPTVYSVKESKSANLLDLDKTPPKAVRDIVNNTGTSADMGDFFKEHPQATLRQWYDDLRAESGPGTGISADDVQESFAAIQYKLEKEGYSGLTHIGGQNKTPHRVNIYWNPKQSVEIGQGAQLAGNMKIPSETGEPVKAADAVQQATDESQRAGEDSKAFQAAVDCYTKGGV